MFMTQVSQQTGAMPVFFHQAGAISLIRLEMQISGILQKTICNRIYQSLIHLPMIAAN
ncbi:hypothetical protein SEEE3402_18980 [Salmonella enterica subsp. enterica serovar Enteritidis str. 3402]|nr:hypothetical protein SEEE3402_18980 [Salmonella enterica subsp. enterica serovar Enteritidis str. 3402]